MNRWTMRLAVVALAVLCPAASAQTRAWLDRDRIALGETTTLNVETDTASAPDYAPLLRDFDLSGHASRQQVALENGRMRMRSLYAVALRPRRDGLLPVPALRVGGRLTAPLTLLVTPAPARVPQGSGDVFIESEADDQDPYVQQSVGWVVRLYSAIPLIAGRLDQDEPDGASLQRVGEDLQFRRTLGGRSYVVTERRYLLIPERSGELVVPPARFDGRGTGNAFDRLFGDGQDELHAVGRPRVLGVRPIPANAPQPWLPLRSLTARYLEQPRGVRAGEAASIAIEIEADGATAAQLPPVELPATDRVQVFAERPQSDESMVEGRPRVRLRRRFSVVPSEAGTIVLPGPRIDWWDTRAGVARTTRLAPITLRVAPGARVVAPPEAATRGEPAASAGPGARDRPSPFMWGALLLALGGLVAALLYRSRRPQGRTAAVPGAHGARPSSPTPSTDAAASGTENPADAPAPVLAPVPDPAPDPRPDLERLLREGDLARIDAALRRLAGARTLDDVALRLEDAAQQQAVDLLRRARWADGDSDAARQALRRAFARGPHWRAEAVAAQEPLPPLYPDAPRGE